MATKNRTTFMQKLKKMFQQNKKVCQNLHPTISTPARTLITEAEFNYQYTQFTRDLPIHSEVQDNLKYLFELYSRVCASGGLVEALATNRMNQVMKDLALKFPDIGNMTPHNVYEHYVQFQLLSFEVALKIGRRIQTNQLINLQLPRFINSLDELNSYLSQQKSCKRIFSEDIVVVQSFCKMYRIEEDMFNFQKIVSKYGNESIRVIVQDVNQREWQENMKGRRQERKICDNVSSCCNNLGLQNICKIETVEKISKSQQLKQQINELEMTISDFNQYFNLEERNSHRFSYIYDKLQIKQKTDQKRKNLYANKFDPNDQLYVQNIYKHIKNTLFCFKHNSDLLCYADEDIPGATFPSFQFQVPGNWSGVCTQSLGMAKVDVNFGPDPTQWLCISADNSNKLWTTLRSEYSTNPQKIEGSWMEEIQWFIQRNIPLKKIVQLKGDCVIMGSGSAYWKKSRGKSTHISWNIMPKTEKQIVCSINKLNRLKQSTLSPSISASIIKKKVPIKTIFMRVLNHQQYRPDANRPLNQDELSMPSLVLIRQSIKKWIGEEEKFLNQMTIRQDLANCQFKHYYLFDGQSFCNFCHQQILNYFVNNGGLSCLECLYKSFVSKTITQLRDKKVYFKYDYFWINQLAFYGANRWHQQNMLYPKIEELCKGEFIGDVNCKGVTQILPFQDAQIVQNRQHWFKQLESNNQQGQDFLSEATSIKIIKLFQKSVKASGPLQSYSINNNFEIQTDLTLTSYSVTNQELVNLLTVVVQSKEKEVTKSPNYQNQQLSQQSFKRKLKRIIIKSSQGEKSQTQCSEGRPRNRTFEKNGKIRYYHKQQSNKASLTNQRKSYENSCDTKRVKLEGLEENKGYQRYGSVENSRKKIQRDNINYKNSVETRQIDDY